MTYVLAALRAGAWLAFIFLAVASLTPGDEMVRTGLPGKIEHVIAYLIAAALWLAAYPRRPLAAVAGLLLAYAGLLEIAQLFVPGRTSQVSDFLASGTGVMLGLVAGLWARARVRSWLGPLETSQT